MHAVTYFYFKPYPASARLAGCCFLFWHQKYFVRRRTGE
jgi:hypothetical protein